MAIRVWVDAWQMHCCGGPFAVGDNVSWSLYAETDSSFLVSVSTPEVAESVQFGEEHHGGIPDESPETRLKILRIQVARCRVGQQPGGDPGVMVPLPGTGILLDVDTADGGDPERDDRALFGFVVDVEPEQGQPLPST